MDKNQLQQVFEGAGLDIFSRNDVQRVLDALDNNPDAGILEAVKITAKEKKGNNMDSRIEELKQLVNALAQQSTGEKETTELFKMAYSNDLEEQEPQPINEDNESALGLFKKVYGEKNHDRR